MLIVITERNSPFAETAGLGLAPAPLLVLQQQGHRQHQLAVLALVLLEPALLLVPAELGLGELQPAAGTGVLAVKVFLVEGSLVPGDGLAADGTPDDVLVAVGRVQLELVQSQHLRAVVALLHQAL
jgi:hypothetical protein